MARGVEQFDGDWDDFRKSIFAIARRERRRPPSKRLPAAGDPGSNAFEDQWSRQPTAARTSQPSTVSAANGWLVNDGRCSNRWARPKLMLLRSVRVGHDAEVWSARWLESIAAIGAGTGAAPCAAPPRHPPSPTQGRRWHRERQASSRPNRSNRPSEWGLGRSAPVHALPPGRAIHGKKLAMDVLTSLPGSVTVIAWLADHGVGCTWRTDRCTGRVGATPPDATKCLRWRRHWCPPSVPRSGS